MDNSVSKLTIMIPVPWSKRNVEITAYRSVAYVVVFAAAMIGIIVIL